MPDTDQPKIYEYLDGKFKDVYEKIGEQGEKIVELSGKIDAANKRELPAKPCREYMEMAIYPIDKKTNDNAHDINELGKKVDKKVSYGKLWAIGSSIGTFFLGLFYVIKAIFDK